MGSAVPCFSWIIRWYSKFMLVHWDIPMAYAQLYQYCGSLICIGLGLPPPKLLIGVNRKNPSSMTQIIRNPSIWSTYINSHQRVTNVSPTCHQRVTCHLFDWSTICSSRGHTEHWQIRLRDFMQTALMESHLASWRIFKTSVGWVLFLGDYTHHFLGGMIRISLGESWPTNGMDRGINWTPALTNSWCKPTCELRSEQTLSA